ncbi:MAG: HD domain-containing protein [Bdellovibrionota bacterium]
MHSSHSNLSTETFEGLLFIQELDKLKTILRQTLIYDESRRENTAEHSWHLATAVLALTKHSNKPIQLERALKMALLHDVVEIDADDTFVYDAIATKSKAERELKAADRIFHLLPLELAIEFKELWLDYEAQNCPESNFVASLDKLLPMIANFNTEGTPGKSMELKLIKF